MNRALERTFETVSVDPRRLAIGGFSDGATYALSVGLINGDLFRRVVAFSPGFVVGGTKHGKPRIFVSHGTADPILPIDECSGIIVPALLGHGYDVNFKEFEGGHGAGRHRGGGDALARGDMRGGSGVLGEPIDLAASRNEWRFT